MITLIINNKIIFQGILKTQVKGRDIDKLNRTYVNIKVKYYNEKIDLIPKI